MYTQLASNHSLSRFLQPSTISHHHHNMQNTTIYTSTYIRISTPNLLGQMIRLHHIIILMPIKRRRGIGIRSTGNDLVL